MGDAGGGAYPADTCGAVGPHHFVSIVNVNVSVWDRMSGARILSVGQPSFFGSNTFIGDARCIFDPHSERFIATSMDGSTKIYLAVSETSDPTGAWFKTSLDVSQGVDAGHWPDYPTLGVDRNGIYVAAYMVNAPDTMSLFAIDKAPLVAPVPSLGTVTAFRSLPWEGAIQPCVTFGNSVGEYCITYSRIYRVDPPLTAPTLTDLGSAHIPPWGTPPTAPSLNGANLGTLDGRLLNAVFRNGSIWTAHGVSVGGRAACRWYEIGVNPIALAQSGTIDDPVRSYFIPGIAVNAYDNMVIGFTGSSASEYASTYVTGRKSTDPRGETGPVILMKAGEAPYQVGGDPSRWGDYSLTTIDPINDLDFWTIQEYARSGDLWGTWIAQVLYDHCAPVIPTSFCTAAPNSYGAQGATMSHAGTNSVAQNNFELDTYGVPPGKICMYLYGSDLSGNAVFGNGYRCIKAPLYRVNPPTTSNLLGDVNYPLDLGALPAAGAITAGSSWGFMCWYRDPAAGGAGFNASDGLATSWCP